MLFGAADIDPVAAIGKYIADALVRGQQTALLIDKNAIQCLGKGDAAGIRIQFSCQHFQQGGFSCPIGSDDADPVAALDTQGEITDDNALGIAFAKGLGNIGRGYHRFGSTVVAFRLQFGRARWADHRRTLGPHFPKLLQPALIALPPCGDTTLEPVCLEFQLRIKLFR